MAMTCNCNIIKLFDDLYEELDYFTRRQYTDKIGKIINASYDVEIKTLIRLMLTLRKIRAEKLLQQGNIFAKFVYKKIICLLNSQYPLNNGDVHPIGMMLSLVSCADKAQDILNVKRLKNVNTAKNVDEASPFHKYITEVLKMNNNKIQPTIKDTSLHGSTVLKSASGTIQQVFWFRIILSKDTFFQDFKKLMENPIITTNLIDIGTISEVNGIIELYYRRKTNLLNILVSLNEMEEVKEILFCSDLVRMSRIKTLSSADIFSNMIKFYYIYKTYNLTFILRDQKDAKVFSFVYILCCLFMYSPNLTSTNSKLTPSPMSAMSCANPMFSIKENSKILETITDFEKIIIENNPEKLNLTAASKESLSLNARHKVFAVNQDRDNRILTGHSQVGGISSSEICIIANDEYEAHMIDVLKSISIEQN